MSVVLEQLAESATTDRIGLSSGAVRSMTDAIGVRGRLIILRSSRLPPQPSLRRRHRRRRPCCRLPLPAGNELLDGPAARASLRRRWPRAMRILPQRRIS